MKYEIINELIGKTAVNVYSQDDDELHFVLDNGEHYVFLHHQDCCERVSIDDVVGDLSDLIGNPLLMAEEASSDQPMDETSDEYVGESVLWTFYKFATIKGYVDVRWLGTSNGYYSEHVDLVKLK